MNTATVDTLEVPCEILGRPLVGLDGDRTFEQPRETDGEKTCSREQLDKKLALCPAKTFFNKAIKLVEQKRVALRKARWRDANRFGADLEFDVRRSLGLCLFRRRIWVAWVFVALFKRDTMNSCT